MRTFRVIMTCTVRKEVTVKCEDEEEARDNPWENVYGPELEVDMIDWEVAHVEEM